MADLPRLGKTVWDYDVKPLQAPFANIIEVLTTPDKI